MEPEALCCGTVWTFYGTDPEATGLCQRERDVERKKKKTVSCPEEVNPLKAAKYGDKAISTQCPPPTVYCFSLAVVTGMSSSRVY